MTSPTSAGMLTPSAPDCDADADVTPTLTTIVLVPGTAPGAAAAAAADEPESCYICFDTMSEPGALLVASPCPCAKNVHKACLARWIATKGSRLCSICKGKLPIDFTVEAPFVVLQVVRHMRGLHWAGEREYIISFVVPTRTLPYVTIGSGGDCDLILPDPSLSRIHSRVSHRDGSFYVEDMASSAGTFLKLTGVHALPVDTASIFKLGRTMLTIKVERRKAGGSSTPGLSRLRSWRAKHKKLPLSPASAAVAAAHGITIDAEGNLHAAPGVSIDAGLLERDLQAVLGEDADGKLGDGEDADDAGALAVPLDRLFDDDVMGFGAPAAGVSAGASVGAGVGVGAGGVGAGVGAGPVPTHSPALGYARASELGDEDEDGEQVLMSPLPAAALTGRFARAPTLDEDEEAEFQAALAAATAASLLTAPAPAGEVDPVVPFVVVEGGDGDVEVDESKLE